MQIHSLASVRLASVLLLSLAAAACGGGSGGGGSFVPNPGALNPVTIAPIIPPDPGPAPVSCTP